MYFSSTNAGKVVKRLLFLLFFLFVGGSHLDAAHLVGGEISYRCIGNHNYEISLTIYRDCLSQGAPFDSAASITIYTANNTLLANLEPVPLSQNNLPIIAPNNCTTLPNNVCTEKAIYRTTINLPPVPGGYILTHQRCCRNQTISNIPSPDNWGNTYSIAIPSNDVACNSSPRFNADPPVVLCLNQSISLDLSAHEDDGDSLYYSLCYPLHGGGRDQTGGTGFNSPRPSPAAPPPYAEVPFMGVFSPVFPMPASPPLNLNARNGRLTGRPTQVGQYVFAVCVEEYRNGVLLSTLRRDFQFNISGSCRAIISRIEAQVNSSRDPCAGKTVHFEEDCINASTYYWDFGDPLSTTDVSTDPNPIYTYTNAGSYTVMLVADPNTSCADTSYEVFTAQDPISAQFTLGGDFCFDTHSVSFEAFGNFSSQAAFSWDFGGNVSQGNASVQNPRNVRWGALGAYLVRLTVSDAGCESIYEDSVYIYPAPILKHYVPDEEACARSSVSFTDSSEAYGQVLHKWDFGDGNTSSLASPSHQYTQAGVYSIRHTLITLQGCTDTLSEFFPQMIRINPVPEGELSLKPSLVSVFEPFITVKDSSEQVRTETFIPGKGMVADLDELTFKGNDTGNFKVTHITYNAFGCTDTLELFYRVVAPLNFYVPNAFTPNADGLNETFKVSVTGIRQYAIQIYDRWGGLVFESTDQEYSWNGRIMNHGAPAPLGYYTYLIEVTENETRLTHRKRGTIALLR